MNDWLSLSVVVAIQALLLSFVVATRGPNDRYLTSPPRVILLVSAFAALPFGVLFDFIFGTMFGFFSYRLEGAAFLIINAVLSYGVSLATVMILALRPLPAVSGERFWLIFGSSVWLALSIVAAALAQTPLARVVAVGSAVIAFGEVIELIVLASKGPVAEFVTGRWKRAFRNWLLAVAIGGAYELTNWFFPVWDWSGIGIDNPLTRAVVISVSGYVVLFHLSRIFGLLAIYIFGRRLT